MVKLELRADEERQRAMEAMQRADEAMQRADKTQALIEGYFSFLWQQSRILTSEI